MKPNNLSLLLLSLSPPPWHIPRTELGTAPQSDKQPSRLPTTPSSRRRPGSRGYRHRLDPGIRRDDDEKVLAMNTAIQQHRLIHSLTIGNQSLPLMQALQESFNDKPTASRKPHHPGKYPGLDLAQYPDQVNNRLVSLPPRHPGEGRDPEATGTDWIPASAGMTMRGGCQ